MSFELDEEAQAALDENSVAIIGMAGRFPGADNVDDFWANLISAVPSIVHFSDEQLRRRGVAESTYSTPGYVKAGAFIEQVDAFDAAFFDMTPREAEITDPQHRVLLECAYDALQSGGYDPKNYDGSIAVYAGVGLNTYLISNLMTNPQVLASLGMHQLLLGNDKCYAATRVSYKLDLKGPCISLDTACSTSLVAIVSGYKALLGYECDMVLAGASKVNAADNGYMFEPGGINSPDGFCRAFDEQAAGTVFGSGAGMLLLKRYLEAVEDEDNIIGIIRGGAINNDGSDKVGFTAPSVTQQAEVIREAFAFSELPVECIDYVEAHGTGTKLGDPVEITALSDAFGDVERQSIGIGSVKPNVGHLESAAGVTSLIKVLQAMRHELLPPSLHVQNPNPVINFPNTPFYVVDKAKPWPRSPDRPRRACVSSFGLGGTNSHIIVEEPPRLEARGADRDDQPEVIFLSGKTARSAQLAGSQLIAWLKSQSINETALRDMSYTSLYHRIAYDYRSAVVVSRELLNTADRVKSLSPINVGKKGEAGRIAFSMPGQGSQYPGMCGELAQRFDVYRQALEQAYGAFKPHLEEDLMDLLLNHPGEQEAADCLAKTELAQPAIFLHGYAMAKLLNHYGIEPDAYFGHSLGEFLAAALSGVMSLNDAAKLVCTRAKLMASAEPGAMLAVATDIDSIKAQMEGHEVEVAAINSATNVVVSGKPEAIAAFAELLQANQIECQQLRTSHAYHCQLMAPLKAAFAEVMSKVILGAPNKPFISSISGEQVKDITLSQPQYWVEQFTETVNFAKGCQVLGEVADVVVDLGPSRTVSGLIAGNLPDMPIASMSRSTRQMQPSDHTFLAGLAQLWSFGVDVDWDIGFAGRQTRKTQLPPYAFDKVRCWIDAPKSVIVTAEPASAVAETTDDEQAQTVEGQIIAIWSELLGRDDISVNDDFFALGGQSLLATRMLSRIQAVTGVEVSLADFFEAPGVVALADKITTEQLLLDADEEELAAMMAEMDDE